MEMSEFHIVDYTILLFIIFKVKQCDIINNMKHPNFNEEKRLKRKGYKFIIGLDEVGRGCLAGPVLAAAVYITNNKFKDKGIKDSKKLSFRKREQIYNDLMARSDVKWGIGRVSEKIIDKINIFEAAKLAMKKAVLDLERKMNIKSDFLILDGNFKIGIDTLQKSIIKADEKVLSCALASIIAKVKRDRIMSNYHNRYPDYLFNRNKGYGTKVHIKQIKNNGPCFIHRKTFFPVKEMIE